MLYLEENPQSLFMSTMTLGPVSSITTVSLGVKCNEQIFSLGLTGFVVVTWESFDPWGCSVYSSMSFGKAYCNLSETGFCRNNCLPMSGFPNPEQMQFEGGLSFRASFVENTL